jgi:hypothetical protein
MPLSNAANSSAPPGDSSPSGLGELLHRRRYTGTSYFLGAAGIFLPLPIMVGTVMFTSKPTNGPDYSVGQKLLAVAISAVFAAAAASLLVVKGRRLRGMVVEVYEQGMRFVGRGGIASAFRYSDVQELKRRAQLSGALISLTFVLGNGQSHTATVNRPRDARMLQEVLSRFGAVNWGQDDTFRFW